MVSRPSNNGMKQEYLKERRRIKQFVARAEKRGYNFAQDIVPDIPDKIKRSSINKLKALTPEKLYSNATYSSPLTGGEIVSGTEGRRIERSLSKSLTDIGKSSNYVSDTEYTFDTQDTSSNTPTTDYDYNDYYQDNEADFEYSDNYSDDTTFYDRVVISNWRAIATEYKCRDLLIAWVDRCVAQFGEHETAQMIQTASENGVALGISIKPSDKQEAVSRFLSEMLSFMAEVGQFTIEEMMDALEMEESYEPI